MANDAPTDSLRAAILTIGDEIVTGHLVDTNAAWLSTELSDRNVRIVCQLSLPDDQATIASSLRELCAKVDFIVATGGLGPTMDDITRYALAEAMDDEIVIDSPALDALKTRYAKRGAEFPQSNVEQAQRPSRASCIPNSCGTAPGLFAQLDEHTRAFFMPGIPREMTVMFNDHVLPMLAGDFDRAGAGVGTVRLVHCISLAESRIGELLSDLMERGRNPLVATLPNNSVVTVRIRATGERDASRKMADECAAEIERRLSPYVFARGRVTIAGRINDQLRENRCTLAIAESCTGGLLGKLITDVPGSSDVFIGGWQTYTNEMKVKCLGVEPEIIEKHGAVSQECARRMAIGAMRNAEADYALAITGIAGPDGGSNEKPVGTVFVAHAHRNGDHAQADPSVLVRRFRIPGSREDVRIRAALAALAMLHFNLKQTDVLPTLLWEERTA